MKYLELRVKVNELSVDEAELADFGEELKEHIMDEYISEIDNVTYEIKDE